MSIPTAPSRTIDSTDPTRPCLGSGQRYFDSSAPSNNIPAQTVNALLQEDDSQWQEILENNAKVVQKCRIAFSSHYSDKIKIKFREKLREILANKDQHYLFSQRFVLDERAYTNNRTNLLHSLSMERYEPLNAESTLLLKELISTIINSGVSVEEKNGFHGLSAMGFMLKNSHFCPEILDFFHTFASLKDLKEEPMCVMKIMFQQLVHVYAPYENYQWCAYHLPVEDIEENIAYLHSSQSKYYVIKCDITHQESQELINILKSRKIKWQLDKDLGGAPQRSHHIKL